MAQYPPFRKGQEGMTVQAWADAGGPERFQLLPLEVQHRRGEDRLLGCLLSLGLHHLWLGCCCRSRPGLDSMLRRGRSRGPSLPMKTLPHRMPAVAVLALPLLGPGPLRPPWPERTTWAWRSGTGTGSAREPWTSA